MPERRIIWGPDITTAKYRTGDSDGDTNFVVVEDTDTGTNLLEWDDTAGEWVTRGPVNLSGNDMASVGAFDSDSVSTESLSHNPASDIGASVNAAISEGLVVALSPGSGSAVFSPGNYATDDGAAQAAVDYLEANTKRGGWVHIPAITPSGDVFTVENTVATDDTLEIPVSIHVHSGDTNGGTNVIRPTTTINDGSFCFRISGNVGTAPAAGVSFRCDGFQVGSNNAGVIQFEYVNAAFAQLGRITECGGTAVEYVDSLNGGVVSGLIDGDNNSATGIHLMGADGVAVSPAVICVGTYRDAILIEESANFVAPRNTISGALIEGADGTNGTSANIRSINGAKTVITDGAVIGPAANGAHGIYADGQTAIIKPGYIGPADGSGIETGANIDKYRISPYTDNRSDPAITVNSKPTANNASVVPKPSLISNTTNYPAAPWTDLWFHDGTQKVQEGTTTVTAGSSTALTAFAGEVSDRVFIRYGVTPATTTSGADVDVNKRWNGTNEQVEFIATETESNTDVDVNWVVYREN